MGGIAGRPFAVSHHSRAWLDGPEGTPGPGWAVREGNSAPKVAGRDFWQQTPARPRSTPLDPTRNDPERLSAGATPRVAQEVQGRVDLRRRRVGSGHEEARSAGHGHACQLAPRLRERTGRDDLGGSLVDEDDRRGPPDRDLLPERPDPGSERRIRRLVTRSRDLQQVGEAVSGGDERVVGRRDRRVLRQDRGAHQPAPEEVAEPALEVVAGFDADRRRIEPDEQQAVAQRRQVGEGLELDAVDEDRRPVGTRSGSFEESLHARRNRVIHSAQRTRPVHRPVSEAR